MVLLILNWNLEVINYFIAAILSILSVLIIFQEYARTKHRYYFIFMIIWALQSTFLILGGISLLIQSIELFKWSDLILIPFAFLIIYVLDILNFGSLEPIKMFFFGISATGLIYSIFSPDAIIPIKLLSGSPSYQNYGTYDMWTSIFSLQVMLYYFIFCLLIFIKSPKSLNKKARFLVLLGGSVFSVFSFIIYITKLTKIIPGILMISMSISVFILSLSFKLEPKLLNVIISSADEAKAKLIRNILPICSFCKNIKDGEGNWHQVEQYVSDHSKMLFSHGLCPVCQEEHYSKYLVD